MKLARKIFIWSYVMLSLDANAQSLKLVSGSNVTYQQYYVRIQQFSKVEEGSTLDTVSVSELMPYRVWLEKIFAHVLAGRIKAYNNHYDKKPLSKQALFTKLNKCDTVKMIDPTTLQDVQVECKWEIQSSDICLVAFYERWRMAPNGRLRKKLIAYAPVYEIDDNNVHFSGLRNILFWIKP